MVEFMPTQWKMQDCIIATELGNGRFLFNFNNEEDMLNILKQGPFHYNYFMFVLVRWELVVDEDYLWIQLLFLYTMGLLVILMVQRMVLTGLYV